MNRVKRLGRLHPKNASLIALVGCLAGILAIGVALAALTTSDERWIGWSFSRLGEGRTLSSSLFNGSLLVATIIMWRIADVLSRGLSVLRNDDAARLTRWSLRAIAVCLIGVALFPNDTNHHEHLLFARGMIVLFTLYALILPTTITHMSRRGRALAYMMPALAIILTFRGYIQRTIPFVLFETLLSGVVFCWFFAFCWLVQRREREETNKSSVVA